MKYHNIKYILYSLILNLYLINSNNLLEIHHIISGTLNGTASYVSLDDINHNESYIYFSFDFKYHNSAVKRNFNTSYFLISSDFELKGYKKEKIKYGFLEQNWDEIKNEDDIKNITWKTMKLIRKEKNYNDFNYYFRIRRRKIKMNTVIIRIPLNGRNEGFISVENILDLPDFNKNETISDL